MKKLIYILTMGLLLFGCKDPYGDEVFKSKTDMPIGMALKDGIFDEEGLPVFDKEQYTLWVELLEYTDLYKTLNVSGTYTYFPPNNDAVTAYLQSKGFSTVQEFVANDVAFARELVKYHWISSTAIEYADFRVGSLSDTTATGDYLSLSYGESGGINDIYLNSEARITQLNVEATNGYIHFVDKVLNPIEGTIWSYISENPDYSIFAAAVESVASGSFADYLDRISYLRYTADGQVVAIRYRNTLFVVSDETYNDAGIYSLGDLSAVLAMNGSNMNSYIYNKVKTSLISYTDMTTFPQGLVGEEEITSKIENMEYGMLAFADIDGQFYINYDYTLETGVQLLEMNIPVKNGLLHVVDDILPLREPDHATVQLFEFTNYTEVQNKVGDAWGNPNREFSYTYTFGQSATTVYTWEAQPKILSSSAVRYHYAGSRGNSVAGSRDDDLGNHNYLQVTLGATGYITMELPAIVKGKYKVYFSYLSPGTANRGLLRFFIDNQPVGGQISTYGFGGSTSTYASNQLLGEYTFPETGTYTLRIVAGDTYMCWLDYLRFEPITE